MKKVNILPSVLIAMVLLVACGRSTQEVPTPSLPPSPSPTDAPVQAPTESVLSPASVSEFVDITWNWAAQYVRQTASQTVVAAPQKYTILFRPDGSFILQADCNPGNGTYTVDGTNMTLDIDPLTQAECDSDSLSETFLALLEDVGSFGMQEGVLVLVAKDGNTNSSFTNAGPAGPIPISQIDLITLTLEELVNISWQLVAVDETTPVSQPPVFNPQDFGIIFRENGRLEITADCNMLQGTYESSDYLMDINLDSTSLADCGSDSLSSTFLEWLDHSTAFGGHEDNLVLVSGDRVEFLEFQNAGSVPREPLTCAWVDMGSVTLDTQDLLEGAQAYCIAGTPYDDTQPPGPSGLPEHVQFTFPAGIPLEDVQLVDPTLYIIPVSEYKQHWNASGNPAVANAVESMLSMLRGQPEDIPASGMPILPFERFRGLNDLVVQGESLDIQMGYGLRFVGRIAEDPMPMTNESPQLYYIFLGFSNDGRYLISFFYPVSTDALPSAAEVSDEERQRVENNYQAYLAEKVDELNALGPSDWEPALTLLDEVITSLDFTYNVPPDGPGIMGNLWLWNGLVMTEPASQSVIAEPQNYTLAFLRDGSLNIVADCNTGLGSYTIDEGTLRIEIGLMTRATCERRSLSDQFVTLLAKVDAYRFDQNQLVLGLEEELGSMLFIFGGPVINLPSVAEDAPRITALEVINVRSGPGVEFPSYGVVPAGSHAELIGVSEDGDWWVIKVPAEIASDTRGWISAEFVEAFNVEGLPVVPIPELGEIELVPPEEGKPTATALEPVNVRSGPGVQYPSYGIAPLNARMEIVGISPDGLWWVVMIPVTLDPGGQGWVSADFVTATNTEDVLVIAPPLP